MSGAQPRKNRQSRPSRLPDLIIGAVTLALLAGFGTLLLGERNKPVVAQTPAPPAAIPASPGTVPEPQVNMPVTPEPAATPQTTPAPDAKATDAAPGQTATTQSTPTSGVAQTQEIPPVPAAPPVEEVKPPATTPATPATATIDTTSAQPPATNPTTTAPAANPVATSANRVPLRSDYRISLGSFSTRKTVENQTSGVRGLGYTVHAIDLGEQYVAQIGPFADEATARRALADIQRTYPSALLYRPRNQTAEATPSSGAGSSDSGSGSGTNNTSAGQNTTPTTSRSETTAQPVATPAPSSGPTYLQVGAFDRAESAEQLVGILKDNNFAPTVNSPAGRKTTVMVGPYSGDALTRAEARLDNAGLDHFRVR